MRCLQQCFLSFSFLTITVLRIMYIQFSSSSDVYVFSHLLQLIVSGKNPIILEFCQKKIYKVLRQFNSRNGPVKAKFAYLCTSGYIHLQNTHLVKLCTCETMVPLPETVLKIVFRNTSR